ncbi:hypothetical protein [Polaromonas sp. CF318]|uniref:hypothetical protein n=1 Tax=Polaromonas sp. CF318 TaxID=1144318 RepID=UPI0012FA203B|nr:hypothetical protein [Polaromonas sp. CF318]
MDKHRTQEQMPRGFVRLSSATTILRVACLLMCLPLCMLPARAADIEKPVGKNCGLASPPAAAGEEMTHGVTLRVYPRAKDIDTRYSGCQALFAPEGEKWIVLSLTEVVNGDAVRVWSTYETDAEALACRFKKGKVVHGNPDTCPAPEFILVKSMAPGCARILPGAATQHTLAAPRPPGCEYD